MDRRSELLIANQTDEESKSYSGNSVTVTDQALKKRTSVTDALGRLKQVYEDPDALNYLTSYDYDVLDSLVLLINQSNGALRMGITVAFPAVKDPRAAPAQLYVVKKY